MQPELEDLKISAREVESLSGFDVGEVFVGGALGGVYRPSALQNRRRLFLLCFNQIAVAILIFVFSLPIGLFIARSSTGELHELPAILLFLQITVGITGLVMLGWNIYMWFAAKRLQTLMHLLDEIDRHNDILQAVQVLDRLTAVGNSQVSLENRSEVLAALRMTRSSLMCGLMTEKILRESRGLLSRRYDLLSNIENNLVTLRAMEVTDQANEYAQLLNDTLQIGMSVQKEMQKFSE